MYKILLLCFIFLVFLTDSSAQTGDNLPRTRIGLFGGISHVSNKTSLPLIPNLDDCGSFFDGDEIAYHAGLNLLYDILPQFVSADLRLYYEKRPAKLEGVRRPFEVLNPISNQYEDLVIDHTYEGDLQYFAFDIGVKVKPLAEYGAYVRGGFDLGNAFFGKDVTSYEQIASPPGVFFPDTTLRHTLLEGQVENTQIAMGATLGVGYEFQLENGMFISPELSYRLPINSIKSDADWKQNIIRASVVVSWYLFNPSEREIEKETEEIIQELLLEDIKVVEQPVLQPAIKKFTVEPVRVRETVVTEAFPLLNYIFFDSASTQINNKYISNTPSEAFSEAKLNKNTLDIYYNLLDIIGARLVQNEKARLTLTGTSDGIETESKESRQKLAAARAEAVRDYLADKWKINPDRIRLRARELPQLPTNAAYEEGFQENRRVELASDDPSIFHPVIHEKFFEYNSSQEETQVDIQLSEVDRIEKARFSIESTGFTTAKDIDPIRENNSFPVKLNQKAINSLSRAASDNDTAKAKVTIVGTDSKLSSSRSIEVIKSSNKFEIGRLNLIVFDFDKSEISVFNKKMLSDFVESAIKSNSIVEIVGSTDRLGEDRYNEELSIRRAQSVANYVKSINPKVKLERVEGIGSQLKYDNNLPEGRFYCRTVMIEVKTPRED